MRHTDIVIAGGGLAGSTAAAMLARDGFARRPGRSAHRLSARPALREARRPAGRDPAAHRPRRAVLRAGDLRRRMLDRALRPPGREAPRRSVRHPLRHAGQHHPRRDSGQRRIHPRQGHGHCQQPRPPDGHAVDRRGDFRAAGRGGERAQHRSAPRARHDARGREQVPLDHARVRSQAGRAQPASISRR